MGFLNWFMGKKKPAQQAQINVEKHQPAHKLPPHHQPKINPPQDKSTPQQSQNPFQEKPIEMNGSTAKKKLGYTAIVFILVNSILGSSLFYLPSQGVLSSGAASIIAWVVLFIIATFVMLYIGELITLFPTSGGTYEYCKRAYGRLGGFSAGWLIWLAGNFGMALNVIAAAEYFIPGQPQGGILTLRIIFAAVWILLLNFLAFRGVDAGTTMLFVFGMIATGVIVLMTLPSFIDFPSLFSGSFNVPFKFSLMQPFFQGYGGVGFIAGLALSLFLISEAFLGFETVTFLANEVKEPKKLHKPLITAIIISGVLMSLYVFSSLGTVAYSDYITNARPFAVQAMNVLGQKGQDFVVFGMYLVIIGAAAAWPITGSRLIRAMARDKLFIKHFAVLHPKYKSPYKAVYFQTFAVAVFSWVLFHGYYSGWKDPYRTVYLMYVLISLIVVSLVLLTVPILRRKYKEMERPYKAPFGTIGPILLVGLFTYLIINWIMIEKAVATTIILLAGSFAFVGMPFYFIVEMFYNPNAIKEMNEKLAIFTVLGEKLFFKFSIRYKLFKEMGDMNGKKVLEFGSAGGTLTKLLAGKVGPKGHIYATDLSKGKVRITNKKTQDIPHVSVYHHPYLDSFKIQLPQKVDGVISVGMLSLMQNPQVVLTTLAHHVKKGAEVLFLDFDKFFYIIPNVKWIQSDQQVKELFRKAGFEVEIERKPGVLWQYINIYGFRV